MPDDSDDDAPRIPAGVSPPPPGIHRTPYELRLERQMRDMQQQFSDMTVEWRNALRRGQDETKTDGQPTNSVNAAMDKEKYAKDDDVKHLSKIVIPETVRADAAKNFSSQLDVFATLLGLHGPTARYVISYSSQSCWSHDFSVEDSLAYMKMDADISVELSLAYESATEEQRQGATFEYRYLSLSEARFIPCKAEWNVTNHNIDPWGTAFRARFAPGEKEYFSTNLFF